MHVCTRVHMCIFTYAFVRMDLCMGMIVHVVWVSACMRVLAYVHACAYM